MDKSQILNMANMSFNAIRQNFRVLQYFHYSYFSGEKFAFGHMYVRPHETFHEPSRKFYPNEVSVYLTIAWMS